MDSRDRTILDREAQAALLGQLLRQVYIIRLANAESNDYKRGVNRLERQYQDLLKSQKEIDDEIASTWAKLKQDKK